MTYLQIQRLFMSAHNYETRHHPMMGLFMSFFANNIRLKGVNKFEMDFARASDTFFIIIGYPNI